MVDVVSIPPDFGDDKYKIVLEFDRHEMFYLEQNIQRFISKMFLINEQNEERELLKEIADAICWYKDDEGKERVADTGGPLLWDRVFRKTLPYRSPGYHDED